jgi:polyisoprenoid-binding protein YceI
MKKILLLAGFALLAVTTLHADTFMVDAASSTLVASALKNESVTVQVKFPALSGSLDTATGKASVSADLKGLSTGNPARDTNIQTWFFEIAKKASFGTATFSWTGKPADLAALKAGVASDVTLTGELSLHGSKTKIGGPAQLTLMADGSYLASFSGWVIDIKKIKMGSALASMNKLCPQPHRVANDVHLKGDLVFKKQ